MLWKIYPLGSCTHRSYGPAVYFAPVFRSLLDRMFKQRPNAAAAVPPEDPLRRAVAGIASSDPEKAPWRNTEISRDEITVAGLTVTASIEFSTSSGLLRVAGESHYQETLRKARATSADPEPVFWASLIPEPDNPYDPNAVKVAIDPFGTVGYLARESARRYSPLIAAAKSTAVRCPCKLTGGSGEKLFIGAVVDVAMSEGARLTSWRPDEKVDYDAIAKYHEMRNATLKFVADTNPLEKSDSTRAIERYIEALARAREYEHFAAKRRLFPLIEPGRSGNEVGILDRLTLCLMRSNRRNEAVAAADAYFAEFPAAVNSSLAKTIIARVDKARTK